MTFVGVATKLFFSLNDKNKQVCESMFQSKFRDYEIFPDVLGELPKLKSLKILYPLDVSASVSWEMFHSNNGWGPADSWTGFVRFADDGWVC